MQNNIPEHVDQADDDSGDNQKQLRNSMLEPEINFGSRRKPISTVNKHQDLNQVEELKQSYKSTFGESTQFETNRRRHN